MWAFVKFYVSPFRFDIEGRTLVVIVLTPDHCLSILLQFEKKLEQIIARTPFVKHSGTFRVGRILINDAFFLHFAHNNSF